MPVNQYLHLFFILLPIISALWEKYGEIFHARKFSKAALLTNEVADLSRSKGCGSHLLYDISIHWMKFLCPSFHPPSLPPPPPATEAQVTTYQPSCTTCKSKAFAKKQQICKVSARSSICHRATLISAHWRKQYRITAEPTHCSHRM